MKRSHEMDLTEGPLFGKILLFVLPLIASNILQLLFNAADTIVVGKFAGSLSLAAVGSTGQLVGLFINLFIGISSGANILIAQFYGSHDELQISRYVHCAMGLSVILGVFVCLLGIPLSESALKLMNTDSEVLPLAVVYLQIYFLGAPATLVYNFGAAILRAVGDTERPLRYLLISGAINVILNLVLVIVFQMDVAGVAIATIISQYVSAFLIVRCLIKPGTSYALHLRQIRLYADVVLRLLQVGLPSGVGGMFSNLSNLVTQSAVNSFGYVTMAANSAATNLDTFAFIAGNAVSQASITFIGQNYGAKRHDRIKRLFWVLSTTAVTVTLFVSTVLYLLGPQLLSLYVPAADPNREAIIGIGMTRLRIVGLSFFLCSLSGTLGGILRGFGKSWSLLILSMVFCTLRAAWVYTVFAAYPTLKVLYISEPIFWIAPIPIYLIILFRTYQRSKEVSKL